MSNGVTTIYQRDRLRRLDSDNRMLRAELLRYGRIMAMVCLIYDIEPDTLFTVAAAMAGTNLERPAWVEDEERRDRYRQEDEMHRRFMAAIRAPKQEAA